MLNANYNKTINLNTSHFYIYQNVILIMFYEKMEHKTQVRYKSARNIRG